MSAIRVLSGEMNKNINESTAKKAALEALRQWAIIPSKNLSTILIAEVNAEVFYFLTNTLLDELGIRHKVK